MNKNIKKPHTSNWLTFLFKNRIAAIIILILILVVVLPWLICDILGFDAICTIFKGITNLIASLFKLVGLA